MKLTTVAVFAAGYIIGARAGRERYAQIIGFVERASRPIEQRASERLQEFISRHPPGRPGD